MKTVNHRRSGPASFGELRSLAQIFSPLLARNQVVLPEYSFFPPKMATWNNWQLCRNCKLSFSTRDTNRRDDSWVFITFPSGGEDSSLHKKSTTLLEPLLVLKKKKKNLLGMLDHFSESWKYICFPLIRMRVKIAPFFRNPGSIFSSNTHACQNGLWSWHFLFKSETFTPVWHCVRLYKITF